MSTEYQDPNLLYRSSASYTNLAEYRELHDKIDKSLEDLFNKDEFERRSGIFAGPTGTDGAPWIQGIGEFSTQAIPYIFIPKKDQALGVFHFYSFENPSKTDRYNGKVTFKIHRFLGDPSLRKQLEEKIRKSFESMGFKE